MALVPNAPQPEWGGQEAADAGLNFQPKRPAGLPKKPPVAPPTVRANAAAVRAQRQYQQSQVETASPTRLIVILYDGAIRFCSQGMEAMQARNYEDQNTYLLKAQRIVSELMASLDRQAGGEVAGNLFRLYAYMLEQLVRANMQDDMALLENVIQTLTDLRKSWEALDLSQGRGQTDGVPSTSG